MLLTSEGKILAGNRPLADLLGLKSKDLQGKSLFDLVTEPPDQVTQYLQACSKTRQMLLGRLTLRQQDGQTCPCRAEGAVIRPWSPESPTLNLLRLQDRTFANSNFNLLNLKIDELTAEIHQRKQAQTELYKSNEALQQLLQKLQKTQLQLVQTEKMSSLGQLVAGVAHEVNNPVNFIHGNLACAHEYIHDLMGLLQLYEQQYPHPTPEIQAKIEAIDLEFLREDLDKLLKSMKMGTTRISEVVKSLRNFSRLDEAEVKEVNIHEGIDSTLVILQSRLKDKPDQQGIEVIKEYGQLPLIDCYPSQLNQVIMNLLDNAIDALKENTAHNTGGPFLSSPTSYIRIRTEVCGDSCVAIRIADNGLGMPETVLQRIFDPFFTTKPVGKGTGLGLSISYQIVTDTHGGTLHCVSKAGQGTEFTIKIPIHQKAVSSYTLRR